MFFKPLILKIEMKDYKHCGRFYYIKINWNSLQNSWIKFVIFLM